MTNRSQKQSKLAKVSGFFEVNTSNKLSAAPASVTICNPGHDTNAPFQLLDSWDTILPAKDVANDDPAQSATRSWRARYVFALMLIAAFCLCGQWLVQRALGSQKNDANLINLAGRQRMLSQKLVKLCLLLRIDNVSGTDALQRRKELTALLGEWERVHRGLQHGNKELRLEHHNSRLVSDLFRKLNPHLDSMRNSAGAMLTGNSSEPVQNLLLHEGEFLKQMDAIVACYQREADSRSAHLRAVELTLCLLTLLVLAGEASLVFAPIERKLRFLLRELNDQNDKLQIALGESQAAARLKSQFLAIMSHEIRTPMNGVLGMTDLLLETSLSAEQRDYAETVRRSADSLLQLLNDILDFSKTEAGKLVLEELEFSIRTEVEDVLDLLAESADKKGLELVADIAPDVPANLLGDPGRIRQILFNLIGNAIKFTHSGSVSVRISKQPAGAGVVRLRCEVQDTGIGISPEIQRQLFQPFIQADGSTTRKYGGTGLGLAITKQIVERMNGTVELQSEPGNGATFSFTIQLKAGEVLQSTAEELTGILGGKRALVVDDVAVNRRVLHNLLGSWGMLVDEADGARSALELLSRGRSFDVAFLDMQMPEVDGVSLARQIRNMPDYSRMPLILLTSLGQRALCASLERSGLAACLSKPIRQSSLILTLTRAIKSTTPAPAVATEQRTHDAERNGLILVAEDNLVNQRVVRELLRKRGFRVHLAADGLSAVKLANQERYSVILMDCQMPEMDGLEAARRIRLGSGKSADAPIIALTAHEGCDTRELCLAAGMQGHLSKPFRFEELTQVLSLYGVETASPSKA